MFILYLLLSFGFLNEIPAGSDKVSANDLAIEKPLPIAELMHFKNAKFRTSKKNIDSIAISYSNTKISAAELRKSLKENLSWYYFF